MATEAEKKAPEPMKKVLSDPAAQFCCVMGSVYDVHQ